MLNKEQKTIRMEIVVDFTSPVDKDRSLLLRRSSKASPRFGSSYLDFTCRNCGGGDRGRVAIYRPFGEVSLSLNRTVTCMVLKANDRRTSCPCHDEFRGPRSNYVKQVALATTTTTTSITACLRNIASANCTLYSSEGL
ncbi:uncharacterized protein TNCV_2252921 [Trichonephila clavipes]|nr:uncharacterized protein TNCV_2252921 [Trichonephila clavipes]